MLKAMKLVEDATGQQCCDIHSSQLCLLQRDSKKSDDATDNPENNVDDADVMTKQVAELNPPKEPAKTRPIQ